MADITTIRLSKETKGELDGLKIHPREPYEDVLERLIEGAKEGRKSDPRKKALDDFAEEMKGRHGEKIEEIILYGSYARGEETEESDVDVLVIWKNELIRGRKIAAEIATKALIDHGVLISPKVISPENYEKMAEQNVPFVENVQEEGMKIG